MPTVKRDCITTSSGIMILMRVGLLIKIRLGWKVGRKSILLRFIGRYGGGRGNGGALDLKGLNPPGRKLVCINNGVDSER